MAKIFYAEVDDFLRKEERYKILEKANNIYNVDWKELTPDKNNNWLNEGMQDDWEEMIPLGTKEAKSSKGNAIFSLYSNGVQTNRDSWVYNFNIDTLIKNCKMTIEYYNFNVVNFNNSNKKIKIDDFIDNDETKISWCSRLKSCLLQNRLAHFENEKIRFTYYRPFTKLYLYFDDILNHRRSLQPIIFPDVNSEKENLAISFSTIGNSKSFCCLISHYITDANFSNYSNVVSFYTYNEDGTGRKENISDWALNEFRKRYQGAGVGCQGSGAGGQVLGEDCKENSEIINGDNNECEIIQRPGCLETINRIGNTDISKNSELSERGNLRHDEPDSAGGNINSGKHSRGAFKNAPERISLSSIGSTGLTIGVGDTSDNFGKTELHQQQSTANISGRNSDNRENAERINSSPLQNLTPDSQPLTPDPCFPTPDPQHPTPITKWDIFYYIYGVLHKPEYRTKYAANLRRELPRIPYYDDFRKYSDAGKKLAELHVNYESQDEYPLTKIETPGKPLNWKVEKMKLSKDKQTLIYNDFLSLTGIPPETFEYKLGNRSALDWLIDQYQIKTDKRSGIVNDPNRPDEPDYILKLISKIITVSLETVKIVREL